MSAARGTREYILYRWWDADGQLLYIGKSVSVLARIARHRASSPFFHEAAAMTMERFPDAVSLGRAEVAAIREEAPKHNIRNARVRTPDGVYTLEEFAAAVSASKDAIRRAVARGDISPEYMGRTPVITHAEGERWLKALPAESKTRR